MKVSGSVGFRGIAAALLAAAVFSCVTVQVENSASASSGQRAGAENARAEEERARAEAERQEAARRDAERERAEARKSLPAVAVMNFKVAIDNGDPEVYLMALREAFEPALSSARRVRAIERDKLASLIKEIELGQSGLIDEATAARLGMQVGAKYMVFGSASKAGAQVRFTCKVVSTETGEIVASLSERGSADAVYDVADALAAKAVSALDARL